MRNIAIGAEFPAFRVGGEFESHGWLGHAEGGLILHSKGYIHFFSTMHNQANSSHLTSCWKQSILIYLPLTAHSCLLISNSKLCGFVPQPATLILQRASWLTYACAWPLATPPRQVVRSQPESPMQNNWDMRGVNGLVLNHFFKPAKYIYAPRSAHVFT